MRFRQTACAVALLVVLAALCQGGGSGLAQNASPAETLGTPQAAAQALDLAAMTLLPSDLEALAMSGYGLDEGSLLTADAQAQRVAPDLGRDSTEVKAGLDAAGFRRRYELQLGLPQQPGVTSSRLRAFVASYVLEYATATGATAGFTLLEAETAAGMKDMPEARAFGDRSEVTRLRMRLQGNQPYQALDLTFQIDNLVAGVTLTELTGQEPTLMTIEALGKRLLAKVQTAQTTAGPDLSNRMLRLAGQDLKFRADEYERIGGETIPGYNESTEVLVERATRYGEAIDVYGVRLELSSGPSQADDVHYLSLLHRFAEVEAARAWLGEQQEREASSPNILAASPVPGAATIGEESLTLRLSIQRPRGRTWKGLLIYVRVGAEVARIQLVGMLAIPLAAVETLARAQLACLQAGPCLDRAPMPVELAPLATPVPAAPVTPVR